MSGSHSRKCRRISSDLLRRSLASRSLPSWVDEALRALRGRGAERPVRGTSQPARGRPRMNTVRAHVQNVWVKLARIQRATPPYSRVHGASTLVVAVCYAILPICPGKPRTRNCPTVGEFAVWGETSAFRSLARPSTRGCRPRPKLPGGTQAEGLGITGEGRDAKI